MAATPLTITDAASKIANRYGLNLKFYKYVAPAAAESGGAVTMHDYSSDTVVASVDFANEVQVELSGDTTWATGGRSHANKVSFNDNMEGTMTISTQLLTNAFLNLLVGEYSDSSTTDAANTIVFNNNKQTTYYYVTGETVWKDSAGEFYTETIMAYKAAPQRAYNVTYTGDGDPSSMDVVFDLTEDDLGNVFGTTKVSGGSMSSNE